MLSLTNITDKPNELSRLTLERAIMCSNIAKATLENYAGDETFYTTGLFSTLDAFFDSLMLNILNDISLDPCVRNAIFKLSRRNWQNTQKSCEFSTRPDQR